MSTSPRLTLLAAAAVLLSIWLLYPTRQLDKTADPNVVEIVYMAKGGPVADAWVDAVREFERHSDQAHAADPSKPRYRVISGQDAARDQVADSTRFLVAVAGGSPPDVIYFDRYAVAEWAARGAFVPLDQYIRRDLSAGRPDTPTPDRFYESCWGEAIYDGKVYGIPISVDDRAFFYNKDLLRRAGFVDESGQAMPPRTWEQLREYARKLTEYDDKGRISVLGFAPNYGNSWLYIYGWMNGGEFMTSSGRRCTLNDPKIVDALQWMRDTYDMLGGYARVSAFQKSFQEAQLDPFVQGKIAMKIDGVWILQNLGLYGPDTNFGVSPPPMPAAELAKGRRPVSWSGGFALAIPATARNKDAAWEFIRFAASDRATKIRYASEKQVADAQGNLYIPQQVPMRELNEWAFQHYVYDNPRIPQKYKDGARVFNELLPDSRYRPVTPVGQLLWNEHINAMESALYHDLSPQQALDNSTQIVQRSLDRFYNPVAGRAIHSWGWFFGFYGVMLLVIAAVVYWWDTRAGFRRRIARMLGLRRAGEAVIEGSRGGFFRRQWFGGFVCAAPWIIGFIVFGGGPMLFSLVISLCDFDILNPARFVGSHNYRLMFSDDRLVPIALWNTAYMVIGIPLGMAVSLGIALLLNQQIRGVAVWRTFFYLPAIVPLVASSVLWVWIFNPEGGLINLALRSVGVEGPLWLQSAAWSKPSLILMGLWSAGGGMIIWLAGLKAIPSSLYEAAAVDGASFWRQFVHVTLPQLTPYILFNLIMGLIGTFQIFSQAFIMTEGGPVNSTLFYVYHLFNNAFRYGRMGYASAMAWVLFVIVMTLTIWQIRLSRRWVHYEAE